VDEGELAALLRSHAPRHSVPGAVLGILHEGSVTTACYGVADVTTGAPVTPESRFSAGSLTKSMAATVIARLAGAGRLALDDPAAAHVPELRGSRWGERATLRDLLANQSGIPLQASLEFGFADRREADDGALARLVSDAAAETPADGFWSYSNLGWCVLGRVIETATDTTWEDAMRLHLLDPAGMDATAFATDAAPVERVSGHDITPGGPVAVKPLVSRAYGPAGTSAVATVTDLLRLARMHVEEPILAPLREVHADTAIHAWLDAWCLGWARFDWDGGPVWGWDGLIDGERSVLRLLPRERAAVVLLTNSNTGRAMYRTLLTDLMDTAFGIGVPPLRREPMPGAAGAMSRFAGVYEWPDRRVEVAATTDGLRIATADGEAEALPVGERTFLVDPADPDAPTLTFGAFDAAGRPHVLYEMLWGLPRAEG